MAINDQRERERFCRVPMQEKDSENMTQIMESKRDRALGVCRLLQNERNSDRFTALCQELNELLEGMHGAAPS